MILVKVQVDTRQVKRAIAELGKKAPTAIMRALNRTAATARIQAVRAISEDLGGIRQKRIRENIVVDKAYPAKLVATIRAKKGGGGIKTARTKKERQGRIPLLEFHARGRFPSRGRPGGVTYRLPTGKGRIAEAFIARMSSGHKGVFTRLAGTQMQHGTGLASSLRLRRLWKRERIVELFGPSIPKIFANRRILEALRAKGTVELTKNMAHEIDRLLNRQGGRRG